MKVEVDRYEPTRRTESTERGRATTIRFRTWQGLQVYASVTEAQDERGQWRTLVSLPAGQLLPEELDTVVGAVREELDRFNT